MLPTFKKVNFLFGDRMNNTTGLNPVSIKHHLDQWKTVKESTKQFSEFIQARLENVII